MTAASAISFTRQGAIMRDGIRIGRIEDDDMRFKRWRVRFTPASGREGILGDYRTLRDAKQAAREAVQ